MPIVDISKIEHCFVIHFETDDRHMNAHSLALTLIALTDAAKAANGVLNVGYEVDVVVESLGPGSEDPGSSSFCALVRAIYTSSKNLFVHEAVLGVAIGVIGNYIYERALSHDDNVVIDIQTEEVIILHGQDRVIVPRRVYEATRKVEKNPQFTKAMTRLFGAVAGDNKVRSIGLVSDMKALAPEIVIPRAALLALSTDIPEDPDERVVHEAAEVQIVKAILEKSKRKWEFVWLGMKISAPVTDDRFYDNFIAHNITIAPGDILNVVLAIKQTKDPATGIYLNINYDVIEVKDHVSRIRQIQLSAMNGEG